MKCINPKSVLILNIVLIFSIIMNISAQLPVKQTGIFQHFLDIGNPVLHGTVFYFDSKQQYSIKAGGSNIWFDNDQFSFLFNKMQGDFIVQAQIRFIGEGKNPHRKTGIMFRESAAPDAPMVACTVHGDGLTSIQYRTQKGKNVEEVTFDVKGPNVLQLERKKGVFIMSVATFGDLYTIKTIEIQDFPEELLAGLFVCSHDESQMEEVEFCTVRIFNTASDSMVQYQQYLGSFLETLEIESGERMILASSPISWQAPNWTPDGQRLIYNSEGKLHYFDLLTHESTIMDTRFAINNNNDHVLSFDGSQMGISDHTKDPKGQSVIYTVPVTGGNPMRVTDNSPSYLHGWSPDGNWLVYTGERNGNFDIYKISKTGGTEIQLTTAIGLDDGSEYSPDGKYIYFCSTRTGTMQIWRMEPDGSNQTQLTFDELNDWFPHVSPDNKWIIFLTFPKDVPADSHPFYKRVYLRIMPIGGGPSKVVAYLYGGQGSINVPSWSPDSKKVAFISNGR